MVLRSTPPIFSFVLILSNLFPQENLWRNKKCHGYLAKFDRDVSICMQSHDTRLCGAITGDIGGYLGLLIGGSFLTIIEVVDLVLYNALLRFIGKA